MTPTLLTGVLLLTARAPNLKDKPRPEATLVGEWAVESVNAGGRPASLGSDRWAFRADGTMSILSRGKAIDSGDYTLGERAPSGPSTWSRTPPGGRPTCPCTGSTATP